VAAPKRTPTEREEALAEVAKWDRRGYSVRAIAAKMGVSHVQVVYDLKIVKQRYRDTVLEERAALVAQKIEQLREVRQEAWNAWEASKENCERQVKEKISESLDAHGNPTAETLQRMKAVITTEGRLPSNEYLTTILRTFEEEADLQGLYAPTKIAPTTPDGTKEYGGRFLIDSEFDALPLAERVRLLQEEVESQAEAEDRKPSGT